MMLSDKEKALIKESYELIRKLATNISELKNLHVEARIVINSNNLEYALEVKKIVRKADYEQ